MKVLLDLRPAYIVASQKKKVDPIRLITFVFFFAFVVMSSINITVMFFNMLDLEQNLQNAQSEQSRAQESLMSLEQRIESLRKQAQAFRDYLEFTNADLPVVEVLAALESLTPAGLKIETLNLTPGGASMVGVALTDDKIVDFAQRLGEVPDIITRVNVPITTKRTLGTQLVPEFSLTLNVSNLGAIFASTASRTSVTSPDSAPQEGQTP